MIPLPMSSRAGKRSYLLAVTGSFAGSFGSILSVLGLAYWRDEPQAKLYARWSS